MVGWHLLLLLVVEVMIYGAIGRHMHVARGWSLGQAIALAIAIYVVVRVVLVAAEFIIARWQGSPIPDRHRVTWLAVFAMYLRELAGWILMFTFVMPWWVSRQSVTRGEKSSTTSTQGPPILLVHGLACNRGNWFWFRRQLKQRGHRVYTMDCTPPFSRIAKYGDQIGYAVDEVLAATGATQVTLIGHSQGGLSIRAYLDRHGDEKVDKIITLGSPHQGTWLARLAIGPNAFDMRIDGEWLTELLALENKRSSAPYAKFTCVFTYHDNLVAPQLNGVLPGAQAIPLSGIGHLSLVLSRPVIGHVLEVLAAKRVV